MVLDLAECGFLDSTGIALIVRADQRLWGVVPERGRTLCGVHGQVRKVLEVSGLAAALDIREKAL